MQFVQLVEFKQTAHPIGQFAHEAVLLFQKLPVTQLHSLAVFEEVHLVQVAPAFL
jgi:hypothetical protein